MSAEEFWTRVGMYNETTLAVQVVLIIAALLLTYRVFARPGARTDVLVKVFLAFTFTWNGVVFFLFFMRNPLSMCSGAPLFMLVSVLFVVDIFARKTHFGLPEARWKRVLTVVWMALVFLYPVIGLPLGHIYPKTLMPFFPCPLTVFAIALVAAATPNADKKVFILLLPWALMGLPKCFGMLDCYEDCILFASGVYGLVELVRTWKAQPSEAREALLGEQEVPG